MNDTEPHDESEPEKPLPTIVAALGAKLNLADFQNAVPVLRELSIVNDTTDGLTELDLSIASTPAFLKLKHWHIDSVDVGQRCHIRGEVRLNTCRQSLVGISIPDAWH